MATDTLAIPEASTQLARFSPSDAAIAKLREEYMPLVIKGVDDREGFELVHRARIDMKGKRCAVERTRKDGIAEAVDFQRRMNAEAKRLIGLMEPVEKHLIEQEDAYEAEKERIKNEALLKAQAEAKAKADAETARLKAIADAEAARVKAEQDAENERLRVFRERLEAERQAIAAEKAKVEAQQKAQQDKIDAERRANEAEAKRLANIEAARLRAIELEKARAEAAEKARVETEQRIAREAKEKAEAEKQRAEAEEAARVRAEALRPDKVKLEAVADAVDAIVVPDVSEASYAYREQVNDVLGKVACKIRAIVAEMG